jgi:hypothetical protein
MGLPVSRVALASAEGLEQRDVADHGAHHHLRHDVLERCAGGAAAVLAAQFRVHRQLYRWLDLDGMCGNRAFLIWKRDR